MRFTENYRLYSADSGESINALEDSRRFLTIDRQLLGLFQIFGNGIIEGWQITKAGGLAVSINPGRGHVFYMSAATQNPASITLTPNATNYIYAAALEETRYNRIVDFTASTSPLSSSRLVFLGSVTTSDTAVESIDMTLRNDISFIEQIKTLINLHKHKGGNENPSKIDLSSEVMNQLPGYRIEGIDASKIVSGRIPASRLPVLEHSDLLHSGILTHAQLDSFVRNLSNPNVRLLGELSTINLLQLYMAMKHIWNEVDQQTTNLLVMVPGITPDSFIDYTHTTAVVDRYEHSIKGVPALSGQLHYITYKTFQDFSNSFAKLRIDIPQNDPNGDFFRLSRPFTQLEIDGFDNVFSNNTEYPNWNFEVIASGDTSTDKFVSDDTKKVDGPYSAKLIMDQDFRVQVTRIFDQEQDWSLYNLFEIYIESLSEEHGEIRIDMLGPKDSGGNYTILNDPIILLNVNETTTGFKRFVKDITSITRDKVLGLRIYTDTSLGWTLSSCVVNVDAIRLQNTLYYYADGFIRFRLQTPQKSQWAAITWDGDENSGIIKARARTASDFSQMDQTNSIPFSPYITTSGDNPNVPDNICMELEVALNADSTSTQSPVVRSITVSFITSSQQTGLTIDTTEEFSRATALKNVIVSSADPNGSTAAGKVLIKGRVDAGDWTYGIANSVQQVDRFGTPVLGISGDQLFISPMQAVRQTVVSRQTGIDGALHVQRTQDRNYLVADTLNDRVILFDENGNVLRCLLSNNVRNITSLYPIQCSYNERNELFYIAWSTNVTYADMDLSKITVRGTGLSVTLSNSLDKVVFVQGASAGVQSGNVTVIQLSQAHAGAINNYIDNNNYSDTRIYLDVQTGAVKDKIDKSSTNYAALTTPRGLPIFLGDIQYLVGIYRPISINITASGNWIISNAKPLVTSQGNDPATGTPVTDITSVIEVIPDTAEVTYSDNSVDFSISTLGAAVEMNEQYVAVCGIVKDSNQPTTTTTTATSTTATPSTTAAATTTTEQDVLKNYRGRVKIIEKSSERVIYEQPTSDGTYGSDVQIDENENLLIVEKYFVTDPVYGTVGRGRVAKLDEDGNVYFQYGKSEYESFNDVRLTGTGTMVSSS